MDEILKGNYKVPGLENAGTSMEEKPVSLKEEFEAAALKNFGKTIDDLPDINHLEPEGAAIVIVGGPSLHRKNSVAKILASGFTGDIVVADGSFGHCLRKGLIPDFVITLDPGALGRSYR